MFEIVCKTKLTWFNPIFLYQQRLSDGNNNNVCVADNFTKILGFRVTDSDCGVIPDQELSHRRAHYFASTNNYSICAGDLNAGLFDQLKAAVRSAWQETGGAVHFAVKQFAGIHVGQTVRELVRG